MTHSTVLCMSLAAPAAAEILHRLGTVVVHSVWQVALAALLLAVVLRLLPRCSAAAARVRYAVAVCTLFSLPVVSLLTFAHIDGRQPGMATVNGPASATAAGGRRGGFVFGGRSTPVDRCGQDALAAVQVLRAGLEWGAARVRSTLEPWLHVCGAVWLAGGVAAAARLGMGWSLTRRLVAQASSLKAARWQARLRHWQEAVGLPGRIRLLASTRIDVPIVIGWLDPVVLWPLGALAGMSPPQIDAVLVHELAHIRRHDLFVNLVQCGIEAIFFHHPAAWWISAQVRDEREHCADDLAIRTLASRGAGCRLSYARAFLALEERRQRTILTAAANGGCLARRIERLAGIEQTPAHASGVLAAAIVLFATAVVVGIPVSNGEDVGGAAQSVARPAATAGGPESRPLPADTDTIESLTADQARVLVMRGTGVRFRSDRYHADDMLLLRGLTSLDPQTAQTLADFRGRGVVLSGVTDLSPAAAAGLAAFRGDTLILDGITTLSVEVAGRLASFRGEFLYLDGPLGIDAAAARALAGFRGNTLSLGGLVSVDAEIAGGLAGFTGPQLDVYVGGMPALDAATARALVRTGRQRLGIDFGGLTRLEADAAASLATFNGKMLQLHGISTLSAAAAEQLVKVRQPWLTIEGLTRLDAEADGILAAFPDRLGKPRGRWLPLGPIKLDADTARKIDGLTCWNGQLPAVTTLDEAAARLIAASAIWDGRLPALKRLSPRTLQALIVREDVEIPLLETLEMTPESDGSSVDDFVIPQAFQERQKKQQQR